MYLLLFGLWWLWVLRLLSVGALPVPALLWEAAEPLDVGQSWLPLLYCQQGVGKAFWKRVGFGGKFSSLDIQLVFPFAAHVSLCFSLEFCTDCSQHCLRVEEGGALGVTLGFQRGSFCGEG